MGMRCEINGQLHMFHLCFLQRKYHNMASCNVFENVKFGNIFDYIIYIIEEMICGSNHKLTFN